MKTIHLVGCVKRDIMRWVARNSTSGAVELSNWYCGTTHINDISQLENYLSKKNLPDLHFRKWLTNDVLASLEISKFFIKNGMRNRPPKEIRPDTRYVYVFKINDAILDDILKIFN